MSAKVWCIYCTKLEPISKTNDSEKAPRAGDYASNPERKNTPCISDLAGVDFFLKKERVFFFRGSARKDIRAVRGASIRTRQNENLFFWGKGFFVLPRLISRPQEGSGEECGRDSNSPNFFCHRILYFAKAKCAANKFVCINPI